MPLSLNWQVGSYILQRHTQEPRIGRESKKIVHSPSIPRIHTAI